MPVRVRFAPSPTGYLHIGGARTALYNFLFARHEGGAFVLRVEDTDQQRNTDASLQTILDGLKWLGLSHDEGPYFQSKRLDLYRAAAQRLEQAGAAYWQDDPGKGRALYFRIDRSRPVEWDDIILGRISVDPAMDTAYGRDLVIVKADGFPTYNFACVVDDADMKFTHVLRGQEHVANTPKQLLLYRALGCEPPRFAHIPLINDPQGAKISKRKTYDFPVTIEEVIAMGYLPGPFVNFLALLGWSPGGDRELMTLDEMVSLFTLDRVNTSPARFLRDKLDHWNGLEIRKHSLDSLVSFCRPRLAAAYDLSRVPESALREAVRQQHDRLRTLQEIVPLTKFAFDDRVEYDPKAVEKILAKSDGFAVLEEIRAGIAGMAEFGAAGVEALLRSVSERRSVKFQNVAQPLRVALTGTTVSPPIHDTAGLLGRPRSLERIDAALRLRQPA